MDADDVAQITESLRQALGAHPASAAATLDEFGWRELLDEEPRVAVSTLFPLAGELLLHGSRLDLVLLHAGHLATDDDDVRVVLPPPGTHMPASQFADDGNVLVDGVVQEGAGPLLVPVTDGDGQMSFVRCDHVESRPDAPIDDSAGWTRIRASATGGRVDADDETWPHMLAAGRRALAHELIGVAGRMTSMTVEHVGSRVQFGQPLGAFQAVKHQLADVHLWREVASLAADAAWEDDGAVSAALTKVSALRFSRFARAVCQQLLGGMGFTWEHDFHRYLRRALTLEPLLGAAGTLHAELGAALRAGDVSDAFAAL